VDVREATVVAREADMAEVKAATAVVDTPVVVADTVVVRTSSKEAAVAVGKSRVECDSFSPILRSHVRQ